jgi:prepilin-type processing-associated H-X9-DG protein
MSGDLTGESGNTVKKSNHEDYGNLLFADGHANGFANEKWHTAANTGNIAVFPNALD